MPETLAAGLIHYPGFLDHEAQRALHDRLAATWGASPLHTPVMPKTGRPFTVRMTSLGSLGWVSDRRGYRYQSLHPETGQPWPGIPEEILAIWRTLAHYPYEPQTCLVNYYREGARMGLHRDGDEEDFGAPVVSVSIGDTAIYRFGGLERRGPTQTMKLQSGDVLVMGGLSRLRYHGIDRVLAGTSTLLPGGGRINLTLRRVKKPSG